MNIEERRNLQALEAIAEDDRITQRRLSTKLSIAIGLTNLYLKRLVHKGYVKCLSVRPNRIQYLITPKGIAEKTRLTYEFMDYSLFLYGQTRRHLRQMLEPLATGDRKRVAIVGSGEAAELAYMSIMELGLELVAVFDRDPHGVFLGKPVLNILEQGAVSYDVMVVASLDASVSLVESLIAAGVPVEKLVTLRKGPSATDSARHPADDGGVDSDDEAGPALDAKWP